MNFDVKWESQITRAVYTDVRELGEGELALDKYPPWPPCARSLPTKFPERGGEYTQPFSGSSLRPKSPEVHWLGRGFRRNTISGQASFKTIETNDHPAAQERFGAHSLWSRTPQGTPVRVSPLVCFDSSRVCFARPAIESHDFLWRGPGARYEFWNKFQRAFCKRISTFWFLQDMNFL